MRALRNKSLKKLSDKKLIHELEKLRGEERRVLVNVLYYLIEIERRSLHLKQGYGSLYEFCVSYLRYSESAAVRRIRVARCMRNIPEIGAMLLGGELNLDAISKVAGIVTKKNKNSLLREISGRSTRQIDIIISRYNPKQNITDRVRPVYVMTETGSSDKKFTAGAGGKKADTFSGSPDKKRSYKGEIGGQSAWMSMLGNGTGGSGSDGSIPRVKLEQKFKLEFAVDPGFIKKLEKLRALLSNKYPKGLDFEKLFEIIIDDYLDRHSPEGRTKRRVERKTKANKSRKTKRSVKPKNRASRNIPQPIRDEVYARDGGRCTYTSPDGKRCTEDKYLQVDHIVPFAMGGDSSVDNLRLLCAKHNNLEAERAYGKKFMEQFHRRE